MSVDIFRIQQMRENDLSAVLAIEQQSYPHPWTGNQFLQELDNPVATVELIWANEHLAGYICYWLIVGELQILNIATSPQFRRQGVAGRLLEHVFVGSVDRGLDRAWLEVRAGNLAAIALYVQQGFVADTVRTGYYRDGEDALLMVRDFTAEQPAGN
ncbi:ribosomal protein S18-alanine N-acetyltransferase [Deltaproteobacteria bacterium]|nr:ribosomal protein S18-alanine N-acetyltransferase [Deltaproteobacteria bacterium]